MMARREAVQPSEFPVAKLLVEARRLEAEGIDIGMSHTALAGLLFRGPDKLRPEPLPSEIFIDPEQRDEHPGQIGVSRQAAYDDTAVAECDRYPLEVPLADRTRIV